MFFSTPPSTSPFLCVSLFPVFLVRAFFLSISQPTQYPSLFFFLKYLFTLPFFFPSISLLLFFFCYSFFARFSPFMWVSFTKGVSTADTDTPRGTLSSLVIPCSYTPTSPEADSPAYPQRSISPVDHDPGMRIGVVHFEENPRPHGNLVPDFPSFAPFCRTKVKPRHRMLRNG